jgi:hypothetical protein
VSRRWRLRRPSCGCIGTGVPALARAAHRSPWMQWRALLCPARLLSAEHDRPGTERWRRCFRGNAGGPIRRPNGRSQAAQLAQRTGIRAASRSTGMMITRAVWCSSPPLRPTLRMGMGRIARADHMAIVKPSAFRPRSRSRRRSAPARDGRSCPAGPSTAEANVPALAGQFPQHTADDVLGAWRPRDSGANQGALCRLTGNARGPIVAPWNTPTVPRLQQPET